MVEDCRFRSGVVSTAIAAIAWPMFDTLYCGGAVVGEIVPPDAANTVQEPVQSKGRPPPGTAHRAARMHTAALRVSVVPVFRPVCPCVHPSVLMFVLRKIRRPTVFVSPPPPL